MPVYPKAVKPGDTVGLVLPSSMIDENKLNEVIRAVSKLGLSCKVGRTAERVIKLYTVQQMDIPNNEKLSLIPDKHQNEYLDYVCSGFMAGNPRNRADDINSFFADDTVDAIWCLRGGYSSAAIMPHLNYDLIRKHPKMILGYSDITNVVMGIYQNVNLVTYHAPMVTPNFVREDLLDDGQIDSYTYHYFQQFVMNDWNKVEITCPRDEPAETLVGGSADGVIIGGNLDEISCAVGTNYAYDPTGKIVFLEETHEHVCKLDMALRHLISAGFFDKVRGVIFGQFDSCRNQTGNGKCGDFTFDRIIETRFKNAPYPVIRHFAIGHQKQTATIPIGASCHLDADNCRLTIYR